MDTFKNFTYNIQIPLSHQSPSYNPDNGFAIFVISVLAISATAFLLLTYYVLATKCYLRCQRLGPSSHLSSDRAPGHEDQVTVYPSYSRRIDEFLIQEIPTFLYTKNDQESRSFLRCVSNSNCPLCRSTISCMNRHRFEKILAPNILSQEDFVVIEVSGGEDRTDRDQEISDSSRSHSSRNLEQMMGKLKKPRKYHDVSVMGDEGIDARDKNGEFSVPPVRRSLSMDSVVDARVHSSIRAVTLHNGHHSEVRTNKEGSSSSSRFVFPIIWTRKRIKKCNSCC